MSTSKPTSELPSKRDRLIAAARDEIHHRGYSATSLANIAEAADVPLGNIYYYFKTKDDLVHAVVADYLDFVDSLLSTSGEAETPLGRLQRFAEQLRLSCDDVAKKGCPLIFLGQNLDQAGDRFQDLSKELFAKQLEWMEQQFRAAGRTTEAPALAVHMLARTQGASALCQTLSDPSIQNAELDRLQHWLLEELGEAATSP